VDGEVTLKDGVTISLTAVDGFRLAPGINDITYTLMTASSVSYVEGIVLEVDPKIARRYAVELVKTPASVAVRLCRKGMAIIVR